MAGRTDFETEMMLKGIEERRREIQAEDKRLIDILRRYGRRGTANVGEPVNEEQRRTREIWTGARAEAKKNKRGARKAAKRRGWTKAQREAAAERMRQRWATRKGRKKR